MISIGIDLGTTRCCVSAIKNGKAEIIENVENERTTPSCIYLGENETIFGSVAPRKCGFRPEYTVYDVKRFLGKRLDDPSLKFIKRNWCFKLIETSGKMKVSVRGRLFEPEALSGMLLKALRERSEERLDVAKIRRVVITVPTYFNHIQRQATIDAGKLAGFEEVKLLTEPTAAAIAYNVERFYTDDNPKIVFVFDLGGGTFDVSVVEMRQKSVKVLAIDGDVNLGGNDITINLLNHVSRIMPNMEESITYINEHEFSMNDEKFLRHFRSYKRLFAQCEEWKKELSTTTYIEYEFDEISEKLYRHEFEEINKEIFQTIFNIVKKCLDKIKLLPDDIDEVLLVGGSSKIPFVREKLKEFFGSKLRAGINTDEAVSVGAAIIASKWDECAEFSDFNFVDLCPYNLGVEILGESLKNCTFRGHVMSVIIPKNTQLPAKRTRLYTNDVDMVSTEIIKIYSGDDKCTLNNTLIGTLSVTGFTPGPVGSVKFEITFIYNENGTLQIEAVEENTGQPHLLTIKLDTDNILNCNPNK